MNNARCLLRPIVLALALLNAACVSSPFIENTRPPRAAALPVASDPRLDGALQYADATYEAYRAKLTAEVDRQQKLATGLLSLAYVVAGAAIGHAHRDVIFAAAGGGALAWQLGTWNKSEDRLLIYVEGMKAMACAKAAVATLRLSPRSLGQIQSAREALWGEMDAASNAVAQATRWLNEAGASQTPNSETAQTVRDELAAAATLFDKVNQALEASATIDRKVDGASAMLEGQVDKLRADIDKALNGTKADLASLPQHIAALGQYADLLAPGLGLSTVFSERIAAGKKDLQSNLESGGKKDAEPARSADYVPLEPREALAQALGELRARRVMLTARLADLSGAISRTDVDAKAELSGCGVDPAKLGIGLRIDRETLSFKAGQAATAFVALSGGTRPYAATPMDAPLKGVTIVLPPDSPTLTVVADASTVAGSVYRVQISDSTHASRLLTLKVDAAMAAAPGATSEAATPPRCQGFESASRSQICLLQYSVQLTTTGEINPKTCSAFVSRIASNGVFDAAAKTKLLTGARLPVDASDAEIRAKLSRADLKNCGLPDRAVPGAAAADKPAGSGQCRDTSKVDKSFSEAEVVELSVALKMNPPAKSMDDRFRNALSAYGRTSGIQPDNRGELSQCLYQALKAKRR